MFEAYRIGIRLSLINNVSTGIIALAGHFTHLNQQLGVSQSGVKALEAQLQGLKRLGLVGGVMAGAGFLGLSLFKGPLEEAKQFQTEAARFAALGMGATVNQQAVEFAKGMNIMGQSARDNLKLLREATSIMGDFDHAKEAVPVLAKMKFGLESVMGGEHAGQFEQMFQAAIKTTELRGALVNRETGHIDTERFSKVLDMMTQAYIASGGLVKPQDYLAAIKTGGVSAKLMNDEMFFYGLGHFMQESDGSRTGTAAMSMFQNLAMGRMSQQVAENLNSMGVLDPAALHYGKTGHITKVDPMGIVNAKDFVANPFKWVNETLVPMLQAKGLKGDELNVKLAQMFGIRTASNLADQFVREQKIADLYVQRAQKAEGIDALYKTGGETLLGQEAEMHAKWRDAMREMGTVVLPIATRAVIGLTNAIKGGIEFANKYPALFKTLVIGFGALAAAMAIGGTLAVLAAGFKGLGLVMSVGKGVGTLLGGVATGLGLVGKASLALAALWAAYKIAELGKAAYDLYQVKNREGVKLTPEAYARVAAGETGVKVVGSEEQRKYWASIGMSVPGINAPWPTAAQSMNVAKLQEPAKRSFFSRPFFSDDTKMAGGSPFVASKGSQTVQVSTQVNLDGRKVGEAVSAHQAREAGRALSGAPGFDNSQFLAPVALK